MQLIATSAEMQFYFVSLFVEEIKKNIIIICILLVTFINTPTRAISTNYQMIKSEIDRNTWW